MQRQDQQRYRGRLEAMALRMRPEVESVAEQARSPSGGQAGGELTNAPMHLADMGTEEYLHGMNALLLENGEHLINEVRAALERINNDLYGACEYCGKQIPDERLEAIPYARYCVTCAAAQASEVAADFNAGRPRGPQDTLAPEGDMNETRRYANSNEWEPDPAPRGVRGDQHAAGTASGGTALGGLAGSNEGRGDPDVTDLDEAMGSGNFDARDARDADAADEPQAGRSGGAVGGTPAGKRSKPR